MVLDVPVILNLIIIWLLRILFSTFVHQTTRWENHKYRDTWEKSVIYKKFVFNFINYYSSLFIIAFVKTNVSFKGFEFLDECISFDETDPKLKCYDEVRNQAGTIFFSRFIEHLILIIVPKLYSFWKLRFFRLETRDYDWGSIDKLIMNEDTKLKYFNGFFLNGTRNDFMNLILEFMFLSIFGCIYPLGFLYSMFLNTLILHINKAKLFYVMKRPVPESAHSIGSWNTILTLSTILCYIMNAGLLVFTIKSIGFRDLDDDITEDNLYVFGGLLVVFFLLRRLTKYIFKGVPRKYTDI